MAGDVFDRAQQSALDLSARLGQDLQSSAIQVGKALNDPVKGVTALQRVGFLISAYWPITRTGWNGLPSLRAAKSCDCLLCSLQIHLITPII